MATVYCFSSTGNSLYAAKRIAGEIGGRVRPMTAMAELCRDDVIGFVFPVYFWGLPRTVAHFVSEMRIENKNPYVFAVITCGGPMLGVLGLLKKLLNAKDVTLQFGTRLITGPNYLPEFKIHDSERKRRKIAAKLEHIVRKIKNQETNRISSFTALNEFVYRLYPGKDSDRYFTLSSRCVGCGTCQRICPLGNIEMVDNKPIFKHNCEHCIGCLHACPASAIDWKENTKGKKRYRNHAIRLEELIQLNKSQERSIKSNGF